MAYPYEYIWEFPGIYSLSVTYGVYNSFYFSQYIALGVINFFEFREMQYPKFSSAMFLTLLCISMMLTFTRGHYSIDIFGGFLFGHYFWMQADKWCWIIDYSLMRIPFHKRFPHFRTQCFNCKEPINKWATVLQNTSKSLAAHGEGSVSNKEIDEKRQSLLNDHKEKDRISKRLDKNKIQEDEKEFSYPEIVINNNSHSGYANNTSSIGGKN